MPMQRYDTLLYTAIALHGYWLLVPKHNAVRPKRRAWKLVIRFCIWELLYATDIWDQDPGRIPFALPFAPDLFNAYPIPMASFDPAMSFLYHFQAIPAPNIFCFFYIWKDRPWYIRFFLVLQQSQKKQNSDGMCEEWQRERMHFWELVQDVDGNKKVMFLLHFSLFMYPFLAVCYPGMTLN